MTKTCPECGEDSFSAVPDKDDWFMCSECSYVERPGFRGKTIDLDDKYAGRETTEGFPKIPLQLPEVVTKRTRITKDLQRGLKAVLREPDKTQKEIAKEIGVIQSSLNRAIGIYEYHRRNGDFEGPEIEYRGDVSQWALDSDGDVQTPSESPKESLDEELRQLIKAGEEDIDFDAIAEKHGVGVRSVTGKYGRLTQVVNAEKEESDQAEEPPEPEDAEMVETKDVKELSEKPEQSKNGKVSLELDTDTVYDLITGGDLTEDQRRMIFEQIVS